MLLDHGAPAQSAVASPSYKLARLPSHIHGNRFCAIHKTPLHLGTTRSSCQGKRQVDGGGGLAHPSLAACHHDHVAHPLDHLPLGQASLHQRLLPLLQLLVLPSLSGSSNVQLPIHETKETLPLKQHDRSQHLTASALLLDLPCQGSRSPGKPSTTAPSTMRSSQRGSAALFDTSPPGSCSFANTPAVVPRFVTLLPGHEKTCS